MRRLKLGQLLDTLPERLALARTNRLPHHDFLELLFADEVTRRDRESAARRAKAAHLDPAMQLQAWDHSAAVAFDQQLWAEQTSLRFLANAYNVLVMGPVGAAGPIRDGTDCNQRPTKSSSKAGNHPFGHYQRTAYNQNNPVNPTELEGSAFSVGAFDVVGRTPMLMANQRSHHPGRRQFVTAASSCNSWPATRS